MSPDYEVVVVGSGAGGGVIAGELADHGHRVLLVEAGPQKTAGMPMWGEELVQTVRRYRYVTGLLTLVNDENHGAAWVDERGNDRYSYAWSETERARNERSLQFATEVLLAAGARRVLHTDVLSTHVQGGCRMGSDPRRSVVDAHGESHDVRRLFVGDGSVIPRTPAVNPSLTIMSLASRLADYLHSGDHGYFSGVPQTVAA